MKSPMADQDPKSNCQNGQARSAGWGRALRIALQVGALGALASGCLTRPVVSRQPTTKVNFTSVVRTAAIDKVDLLFGIDNSLSMGDKQVLLSEAVPDLLTRLLQPNCVNKETDEVYGASDANGQCAQGEPEFEPVQDIHIGIVSSSIGGVGVSGVCTGGRANDKAHLINRTLNGGTVSNASPANFLAWLPRDKKGNENKPKPPVPELNDRGTLESSFKDLVVGVGEDGCGFEGQLESVYRFLVQPDPYGAVVLEPDPANADAPPIARLDGLDGELLQQRRDFLRPDSLVAIVMVTDEDESTVDPLEFGGRGWVIEDVNRAMTRGTSACLQDPASKDCFSCLLQAAAGDPECSKGPYPKTEDDDNIRFFDMKRRFGIDPRYPVKRYVDGFSKNSVPDRNGEHPPADNGKPSFSYVGTANCTNPLFATELPGGPGEEICKLKRGPRTPDLVFFALIGGVPWQLLTTEPDNFSNANNANYKDTLDATDWLRILGSDPDNYRYDGINPHMLVSTDARAGMGGGNVANTREWDTTLPGRGKVDLQYACTFDLAQAKNCDLVGGKPPDGCDCAPDNASGDPFVPPDVPLCDPADKKTQIKGKAYPTIRQLMVARSMGDQAIVASICPQYADAASKDSGGTPNPRWGYRPAIRKIVDRLKNALAGQCLPQPLKGKDEPPGPVGCLILETLPEGQTGCDPSKGLTDPDPQILEKFREQQIEEAGGKEAAGDILNRTVCEVKQLVSGQDFQGESCAELDVPGWCYVTGKAAGNCPQKIIFSKAGNPEIGVVTSLQCIKQGSGVEDGK